MDLPRCTKEKEIDRLNAAVFGNGKAGLIEDVATILSEIKAQKQDTSDTNIIVKDTRTSMHLIEIAVARIEEKLSSRKERKSMSWTKASIIIAGIVGFIEVVINWEKVAKLFQTLLS